MTCINPDLPENWEEVGTGDTGEQVFKHIDGAKIRVIKRRPETITIVGGSGQGGVKFWRTVPTSKVAERYAVAAAVLLQDPGAVIATPADVGEALTDQKDATFANQGMIPVDD
jgi:hypothetical protein